MAANVSLKLIDYSDVPVKHHCDERLPRVGASISNLKEIGQSRRINVGLGTLGFLAAKSKAPNWESLVLVSNRHVLLANNAVRGEVIFQPDYEEQGEQVIFDTPHLNAIAKIDNEGFCGHFSYTYPGESRKSYYIDCVLTELTSQIITAAQKIDQLQIAVQSIGSIPANVSSHFAERLFNFLLVRALEAVNGVSELLELLGILERERNNVV